MTESQDGLPTPARYHAIAVLILAVALSALDGTIVNLALPGIARDLNLSSAASIWVISAYQLAALTMLLPCAALGDRIGYRRVYLAGAAIFTVASLACFAASSLPVLAAARAAQGAGAAGIMAINGAMLRLIYPRSQFGRGVAINSAVVAAAAAAGPAVAAGILSVASWPWLFGVNIPLGLLIVGMGWRALPHNTGKRSAGERVSVKDIVLNGLMFSLVFYGAQALGGEVRGATAAVTPQVAMAMLFAGVAVGAFYLRQQWPLQAPLFPLDLLRIPIFLLSMCTSIATFSAQTLAYVALPFLLLAGWGRSAGEAGLLIAAWPLAILVIAPLSGRLIGRYPGGLLGALGLATLSVGLALLAALPHTASFADIFWRMALCGIGFGLFQSPNNHTILTSAPSHRSGAAGGMLGTARLTGQALGSVLLVLVFNLAPEHDSGPLLALWVAACLAAAASVLSALRVRHSLPAA